MQDLPLGRWRRHSDVALAGSPLLIRVVAAAFPCLRVRAIDDVPVVEVEALGATSQGEVLIGGVVGPLLLGQVVVALPDFHGGAVGDWCRLY